MPSSAQGRQAGSEVRTDLLTDGADLPRWEKMPYPMRRRCVRTKTTKIGDRKVTDSLTPAQVEDDEQDDGQDLERDLERLPAGGKEAEQGIAAGDDRDRNRQHVVDQKGGAGDDAGFLAQGMGGDDVAAAARGKVLDDPGVGRGDDKDGEGRGQGQEDGQVGVAAESLESLLGTVGRGRRAVRAQADPGQERDQGQLVEEGRVLDVPGRAEKRPCGSCPSSDPSVAHHARPDRFAPAGTRKNRSEAGLRSRFEAIRNNRLLSKQTWL